MKHFAILAFAFTWVGAITIWSHGNAIDLILGTWGCFAAVEFAEWAGDKIMARCRARRAQ